MDFEEYVEFREAIVFSTTDPMAVIVFKGKSVISASSRGVTVLSSSGVSGSVRDFFPMNRVLRVRAHTKDTLLNRLF